VVVLQIDADPLLALDSPLRKAEDVAEDLQKGLGKVLEEIAFDYLFIKDGMSHMAEDLGFVFFGY
jgi:hypothetical protein